MSRMFLPGRSVSGLPRAAMLLLIAVLFAASSLSATGCARAPSRYHLAKARMRAGESQDAELRSREQRERAEDAVGRLEALVNAMGRTVEHTEALQFEADSRLARLPSGKGSYSRTGGRPARGGTSSAKQSDARH